MENLTNGIERLSKMIEQEKAFNEKVFHKAKLLLRLYRDVIWRVEETICDMDEEAFDFGGRRIAQLMDFLSCEFEGDMDKRTFEKRLTSIDETRVLIDIVDKALVKLKNYPDLGETYFDIVTKKFINRNRHTDEALMEIIDIGNTMYYRRKKEAINLMGIILWGYILPPLKDYWSVVSE
ncbi:MAG: hypothetical protein HN368_09700 [Spirochaetales bacterium]|jgi:hypothetical protein|nr:hypothetical protein [Spirochaetales bacterium]